MVAAGAVAALWGITTMAQSDFCLLYTSSCHCPAFDLGGTDALRCADPYALYRRYFVPSSLQYERLAQCLRCDQTFAKKRYRGTVIDFLLNSRL